MTTPSITDQLCPAGPYTVQVTSHTKAELLALLDASGQTWPINIAGAYTDDGYVSGDLTHALYWRSWLVTLVGADWYTRDDDTFPVQITPALHRPAPLVELRAFEPQFLDLTLATSQAFAAQQPTTALVAEAEARLDQWQARATFLQDQAQDWLRDLSAARPPHGDDTHAAERWRVAQRNAEVIAREARMARGTTIARWRGVAAEIAATGRFPDFD